MTSCVALQGAAASWKLLAHNEHRNGSVGSRHVLGQSDGLFKLSSRGRGSPRRKVSCWAALRSGSTDARGTFFRKTDAANVQKRQREDYHMAGQGPGKGTVVAATGSQVAESSPELVLCFGEMLIDFVPTVNGVSLADAPAFQKAAGGAPANVAVGIARLGGRAAFLGKVGEDEFGHMLVDILGANGVDTRAVRFDPGARTALAFVTLRADGEREFMFYRNPSADMLLESSELDLDLIRQAGIVHYGSISLIAEPCRSAHQSLMAAAREGGALLSYDPNLRLPLWPSAEFAREEIRSIWDQAHIIKVSDEEIAFLTEGVDPESDEAARALFHPGLQVLLVTEGSKGCRYYTQEFSGRVPGMKVETVDTTGAGDAFVAGFLSQLAQDLSLPQREEKLREALYFANACGALATTQRGAIPALPDCEAVASLIAKVPA